MAELTKIIYDLAETATRMILAVREVIGPNDLFSSTTSAIRRKWATQKSVGFFPALQLTPM